MWRCGIVSNCGEFQRNQHYFSCCIFFYYYYELIFDPIIKTCLQLYFRCYLSTQILGMFFSHRQEKPDNASLEKQFRAAVKCGADLLSTNPNPTQQQWRFTLLHQAAYAGNPLIIRRLITILQTKRLLQTNLVTESHPRGLGEHGYPVELARRSYKAAKLLRNASEWKYRRSVITLMLCIASRNAYALTPQVRLVHARAHTHSTQIFVLFFSFSFQLLYKNLITNPDQCNSLLRHPS